MKQLLLIGALLSLMVFMAGCSQNQESQPPATPPTIEGPEVSSSSDPHKRIQPNAEQQALIGIIQAYYRDLTAEQIDVAAYFTPVVSRFFNARDISREQIAQSLQQGFSQYQSRTIALDTSSFDFVRMKDGMQVSFRGKSTSVYAESGKKVSGDFYNMVTFNEEGLIMAYEAKTSTSALKTQKISQDFRSFVASLLQSLKSASWPSAQAHVHPEMGLFYLVKPGAISIPHPATSLAELAEPGPYQLTLVPSFCEDMQEAQLPTFTCGEPFSQEGCFISKLTKPYQEITELMQAVNAGDAETYKTNRLGQASTLEQYVTHGLLDTEAGMAMYFGKIDQQWYLLVIDKATYDCGA